MNSSTYSFDYLNNKQFLIDISSAQLKTHYVKITLMNFDEQPLEEIQGFITGGNLSVNGSAAIRRTINLSFQTKLEDEKTIKQFGLNKKVRIQIGYKNILSYQYPQYAEHDIIWFPCGIFIIASLSVSKNTSSQIISISGRDKMVLLDGSVGGKLPATVVFHEKFESIWNEDTQENEIQVTENTIFQIIQEAVQHYGEEMPWNIFINDLPQTGKLLVKYVGDEPIWINDQGGFSFSESSGYTKYIKGTDIGYRETPLTYPGELVLSAGESVVSLLDKICFALGNYEFFYDVYGKFIFQKKRSYKEIYSSDTNKSVENMTIENYMPQFINTEKTFIIQDLKNITQINYNPRYENIKNDYLVWGKTERKIGQAKLIRYHAVIEEKPIINLCKKNIYQYFIVDGASIKQSESKELYLFIKNNLIYNNKSIILNKKNGTENEWECNNKTYKIEDLQLQSVEGKEKIIIIPTQMYSYGDDFKEKKIEEKETFPLLIAKSITNNADWREELYRLAIINSLDNDKYTYYYPEVRSEWRKIYDSIEWSESDGWNRILLDSPSNLDYWLDFIDSPELIKYSTKNIGRRMEVLNSEAKNIYNFIPQDFIFYTNNEPVPDRTQGQIPFLLQNNLNNLFIASSTSASAFDKIRDLLYQHLNYSTQITVTGFPYYFLEPNDVLYLYNNEKGNLQKYNITQLSLPLTHSQMMSITANEIFEKI